MQEIESKFTDMTLKSETVTVAGYPKVSPDPDLPHDASTLWRSHGRLTVEPGRLLYLADASRGQSGGPVFDTMNEKKDRYHTVGIHNWAYDRYNAATRISDAVFSKILQWRKLSDGD